MTLERTRPSRDFWNSRRSLMLVHERLGRETAELSKNKEAWEVVRDEVLKFNTVGLVTDRQVQGLPPRVAKVYKHGGGLLFLGDPIPERDDGVETYPAFRRSLSAFAHLLRSYRTQMRRSGQTAYWDVIEQKLEDPLQLVFFKRLRQLAAAEVSEIMNSLEDISLNGVKYRFAGGREQCFQARDCGIEQLVSIARRMVRLARKLTRNQDDPQLRPVEDASGGSKCLKCTELCAMRFKLSGTAGQVELDGQQGMLFGLLIYSRREWKDTARRHTAAQASEIVSCETICQALWPATTKTGDEELQDTKSSGAGSLPSLDRKSPLAAPPLLRTLKKELERLLRQVLGHPGRNQFWIEAVRNQGYRLSKRLTISDETSPELLGSPKVDPGRRPR